MGKYKEEKEEEKRHLYGEVKKRMRMKRKEEEGGREVMRMNCYEILKEIITI